MTRKKPQNHFIKESFEFYNDAITAYISFIKRGNPYILSIPEEGIYPGFLSNDKEAVWKYIPENTWRKTGLFAFSASSVHQLPKYY